MAGAAGSASDWARGLWADYDDQKPAAHYGKAMEKFFETPSLRQSEIDQQVQGKDPGLGYAILASLLADEKYGHQCNVVLTTNFDDLVADALYLFTRKRPLVVGHSALVGFVRQISSKPLVVKLHGDVHLAQKNTESETAELNEDLEKLFRNLTHERGIIFLGYGANDKSVLSALQKLPDDHIQAGIFWVNDAWPLGDFGQWLVDRKAVWVKHLDFDRMMFLIRGELALPELDRARFDNIIKGYDQKLDEFIKNVGANANQPSASPTDAALHKAAQSLMLGKQDAHTLIRQAYLLPPGPRRISALRQAIDHNVSNASLLRALADELTDTRENLDEAEQLYRRAINVDPRDATVLGNFANFLATTLKQPNEAEKMYRRSIDSNPDDPIVLSNFAFVLGKILKRNSEAEQMHLRALDIDPDNAHALSSFANFLATSLNQHERAEQMFRRSIKFHPKDPNTLGNYARYMFATGRSHEGLQLLDRALANTDAEASYAVLLELSFYRLAHDHRIEPKDALREVRAQLLAGHRSPGWDLTDNVVRAREDGHPFADLLAAIAKVIADEEPLSSLDAFPQWRDSDAPDGTAEGPTSPPV